MSKVKARRKTEAEKNADVFTISPEQKESLQKGLEAGKIWDYTNSEIVSVNDIFYGRYESFFHYEKGKIKNDLYKFQTEEGERNLWGTTVLQKKFEELKIVPGDIVAVQYLGKKDSGKGKKPYHNFAISKL